MMILLVQKSTAVSYTAAAAHRKEKTGGSKHEKTKHPSETAAGTPEVFIIVVRSPHALLSMLYTFSWVTGASSVLRTNSKVSHTPDVSVVVHEDGRGCTCCTYSPVYI